MCLWSFNRDRDATPFAHGVQGRGFYRGTCGPRGANRRIHLLLLLQSGIRRAGTAVSDEALIGGAAPKLKGII